jgi:hypothetical protein
VAAVRRVLVFTALALVLCLPASASAQKCVARPGTAALDQYCETVPTDRGQTPARPTDGRLGSTLPADSVSKLERRGKEGAAVLALPPGPGSSPPPSGTAPAGTQPLSSTAPAAATDAPPDAPSSNPVSVAFSALGGVGALGWGLVVVLVALGMVAVASAAATRAAARRSPPAS